MVDEAKILTDSELDVNGDEKEMRSHFSNWWKSCVKRLRSHNP